LLSYSIPILLSCDRPKVKVHAQKKGREGRRERKGRKRGKPLMEKKKEEGRKKKRKAPLPLQITPLLFLSSRISRESLGWEGKGGGGTGRGGGTYYPFLLLWGRERGEKTILGGEKKGEKKGGMLLCR